MGDLDRDTALTGSAGRYTAALSEDWRIWGPERRLRRGGRAARGRRGEPLPPRVVLAQQGRAFLDAQVWTSDVREGLVHDFAPPPDVPGPGLIGLHNQVWDERGRLVASGGGQLLCRRPPAAPG